MSTQVHQTEPSTSSPMVLWFWRANLAFQLLLGVSTGGVKLAMLEFEWQMFEAAGFSLVPYLLFGLTQLLAAVGLLFSASRLPSAIVAAVCFLVATGVLVISGPMTFAVMSLLFPASVLYVGFGNR